VARQLTGDIKEAEVREALEQFDPIWDELFPVEQARVVQLLVERIDVSLDSVTIRLHTSGLASLIAEMQSMPAPQRRRDAGAGNHPGWKHFDGEHSAAG
jgi:site-specific DNA recombinase